MLQATIFAIMAEMMTAFIPAMPSLEPESSEASVVDPSFDASCRQAYEHARASVDWDYIQTMTFKSPDWGLVWRADVRLRRSKFHSQRINRLVCWMNKQENELATRTSFGENIKSLASYAPKSE